MTQDEIMAMARQVGFPIQNPEWQKAAEEFAALIEEKATAKERENWPAEMKAMENQVNILTDELCNAVKSEREACEEICVANGALGLAAAIRARKETP